LNPRRGKFSFKKYQGQTKRGDRNHPHQVDDKLTPDGPDAGLQGLGRVLRQTVRQMDLPARYGGEEFTVILPGTTIADAKLSAERIRRSIETASFRFEDAELRVTVSVGTAEILVGEDVEGLTKRADDAAYASKKAGRNRTHWHDGKKIHLLHDKQEPGAKETQAEATAVDEAVPAKPEPVQSTQNPVHDKPVQKTADPAPSEQHQNSSD